MEELRQAFNEYDENKVFLVETLNKYDTVREQLMKSAQKKCSPKYGLKQWSPTLARRDIALRKARKE